MELSWLTQLEERVREATAELQRLRQHNGQLQEQLTELEQRLEAAAGEGEGEGAWREEREQVRRRVEELAQSLETLLSE